MRIIAIAIKVKDLQPGDLFSSAGHEYWDNYDKSLSIGEKVFIRTNNSPLDNSEDDTIVYKIMIIRDGELSRDEERYFSDLAERWLNGDSAK